MAASQSKDQQQQPPVDVSQVDAGNLTDVREAADKIKAAANYDGTLTHDLLRQLEPLLYLALPEKYIEHVEKGAGVAFEMTGVRSIQVQFDRLNAVLGQEHWRTFTRFESGGVLCRAVVVLGNKLSYCWMDGADNLQTVSQGGSHLEAEVLVERHGWGGWSSKKPGDTYKSAETNALKRVLARVGPAAEVYTQDFEDDPRTAAPPGMVQTAQQPQAPVAGATPPPELTNEQADEHIAAMLVEPNQPPELLAARAAANQAMLNLPQPPQPSVRYQLLAGRAYDIRQLQALVDRAGVSAPPQQAAPPPPPADEIPPAAPAPTPAAPAPQG